MMLRNPSRKSLLLAALLVGFLTGGVRAADPWSINVLKNTPAPNQVNPAIHKLLDDTCIQLLDSAGQPALEIWLRKDVPGKATDAQIQNGLTFREIPESTILGAMRVPKLRL